MMKTTTLCALLFLAAPLLRAQEPVRIDFRISPTLDTARISPYIYGSNGQSDDREENITARRAGGNRWTGYNWENNASNAGSDYQQHSDDYLSQDLPAAVQEVPGIVATSFHDSSLAIGAYSLITLPAAGYVARDKNGTVSEGETAPSARWSKVVFAKGSPFTTTPDLSDGNVYVDEEVNLLVSRYGLGSTPTGVKGYSIDNEPALWPETHPRIHPGKTTVAEVIERGIALSRGVKGVDPTAEMFGPASYGFTEFYNMQDAPDWNSYKSYGTFINAYLDGMKKGEQAAGMRLLDVLDIHWYPEARGRDASGNMERIALSEKGDSGVAAARMQAPRSLWDSSYTEDSWIGQWFSPIALLPAMNASITTYYPGTKLALTEFNYGGTMHISGGIALADVLGIFGRYGVYLATHWGPLDGYISSAYKLFRNYDGARGAFGDLSVRATTGDVATSSIYASRDTKREGMLHVVILNKSFSRPITGQIAIDGNDRYDVVDAWGFDASSQALRRMSPIASASGSTLPYTIQPLTAVHLVLRRSGSSGVADAEDASAPTLALAVRPNPMSGSSVVSFTLPTAAHVELELVDMRGSRALTLAGGEYAGGEHSVAIGSGELAAGVYRLLLTAGERRVSIPVTILR